MQTLKEIQALLSSRGLRPKHRLGQNFLHDQNQLRRILQASGVVMGDCVLEVGPGTGTLTESLLEAGARVVAVELDRDLESILRERMASYSDRFELVMGDALEGKHELNPAMFEALKRIAGTAALPAFKLVANLPYQIASPLLINLAGSVPEMSLAVVMVQLEVAQRMLAVPGGKDYGPLSILLQAMCEVELVARLSPGCFWPSPDVDSAVVRLQRRSVPLTNDPASLGRLLHTLFSKRRKQLGAILGRDLAWPAGVDPKARPEQLMVTQLVELSRVVAAEAQAPADD